MDNKGKGKVTFLGASYERGKFENDICNMVYQHTWKDLPSHHTRYGTPNIVWLLIPR